MSESENVDYERAWREIAPDYDAFFRELDKRGLLRDKHGNYLSPQDVLQKCAEYVYGKLDNRGDNDE